MLHIILSLFMALTGISQDTQEEKSDIWEHFRFLEGTWNGAESGAAGNGTGNRSYEFVLYDKYLHHNNRSEFPPQEKNLEGEIHLDWAFFSYDHFRNVYVMREFHGEGYVITYTMTPDPDNSDIFIFISEHIENAPPGMRARYTINKISDDEFTETFELAGKGKEFSILLENKWTRSQNN